MAERVTLSTDLKTVHGISQTGQKPYTAGHKPYTVFFQTGIQPYTAQICSRAQKNIRTRTLFLTWLTKILKLRLLIPISALHLTCEYVTCLANRVIGRVERKESPA